MIVRLFISFSGRNDGNCSSIINFVKKEEDKVILFKDLNVHECSQCLYQCFDGVCLFRDDDIYRLFESFMDYEKIILLVPMYCGNPSSIYFKFNERSQDFFMHNEDKYQTIVERLYIIGILGSKQETPDFIPCLSKWFDCTKINEHVLPIERHIYNQKMKDYVIDCTDVKNSIKKFLK